MKGNGNTYALSMDSMFHQEVNWRKREKRFENKIGSIDGQLNVIFGIVWSMKIQGKKEQKQNNVNQY